ncbi:MAG: hypothetical protein NVS2B5_26340 [Beijerinckiaceae bacterium]
MSDEKKPTETSNPPPKSDDKPKMTQVIFENRTNTDHGSFKIQKDTTKSPDRPPSKQPEKPGGKKK